MGLKNAICKLFNAGYNERKISKLVASENAEELLKALTHTDEAVHIRAALAINLHCPECFAGLMLPDFSSNDEVLRMAYPSELVRGFRCNLCSFSTNFGVEWVSNHLKKGRYRVFGPLEGGSAGRDKALKALMRK